MIYQSTEIETPKTTTHQSGLAALCYEHAVLRTRQQSGIRLSGADQRALRDLISLLETNTAGVRSLRAFRISIPAWLETSVVKLAATVVGVSGGGLLLTAWSSIRPGTLVSIEIVGAESSLQVAGTVRWSEPRGGKINIGVEFTPVPISQELLQAARSFRRNA